MDFMNLCKIAKEAALAAGKIIRDHMHDDFDVLKKQGGSSYASQVLTEVDKKAEDAILSHLRPTCEIFDLALLSEETEDDGSRFQKDYFWCIDPMDGTLSFINKKPGFSVSIALVSKEGIPYVGVVYDPSNDNLYSGIHGCGVYKNDRPWKLKDKNKYLTYVTDKTLDKTPRKEELLKILNEKKEELKLNGVKEFSGGGAVLNGIRVLENKPACMIKHPKDEPGCGSVWDYAAIVCMFYELGLPATDFKGHILNLNPEGSTFMNEEGVFFENI